MQLEYERFSIIFVHVKAVVHGTIKIRRLYYFDTMNRDEEGTMLITTVDNNKSKLSTLDPTEAKRAQALRRRIGRPSTCDYIHYVNMNMIPNCPIIVQDIKKTQSSYGALTFDV